jgi:hypothetical protein
VPLIPWATVADVHTLTGKTVTQEVRDQAAATIELHTGAIEAVERTDITDRDRYWLKLAVAYQAAWLPPDLFERNDVDAAAQDGESASFRPDAHTLGPLARKALKRLSWRGPRAILLGASTSTDLSVTSERYDDLLPWSPV